MRRYRTTAAILTPLILAIAYGVYYYTHLDPINGLLQVHNDRISALRSTATTMVFCTENGCTAVKYVSKNIGSMLMPDIQETLNCLVIRDLRQRPAPCHNCLGNIGIYISDGNADYFITYAHGIGIYLGLSNNKPVFARLSPSSCAYLNDLLIKYGFTKAEINYP